MPEIGSPAPDFTLPDHDGHSVSLASLGGKAVVLYFYPKDDTPGCTRQACDLRDAFPDFKRFKATVLGVSPDSVESHKKFRAKYDLPFPLLADPEHEVALLYGVWRKKKTFGVTYTGIVRTTFVIDAEGFLRSIIPVKRVAGHAEKVAEVLASLS